MEILVIAIGWIVFCWIVGAATQATVGFGLFVAPLAGLLAANVTGLDQLGWMIAAACVVIPLGMYNDAQEKAEVERARVLARDREKREEVRIQREIQDKVAQSYAVLRFLPDNAEALLLCRDYETYYEQGEMEPDVEKAFQKRIIKFAAPYIEAQEADRLREEELQWREEENRREVEGRELRKRYLSRS